VDLLGAADYDDFNQDHHSDSALNRAGRGMSEAGSLLVYLCDPKLAPHVTAETPAWLWSADASRILWGNPAAAAIFNAATPAALAGHTIDPKGTAALQMARLAGTLPHGSAPRLERLRGFGGRFGGALLCSCSRIMLTDRTPAILVIATEVAGPHLPLEERARRLLVGCDEAVALFSADGALMQATPAAQPRLGRGKTLAALGAGPLASLALAGGHASREHGDGELALYRIGTSAATLLLAAFQPKSADDARLIDRRTPPPVAPPAITSAPVDPPAQPMHQEEPSSTTSVRRQPLRFVWQMDVDHRFTVDSEEFRAVIGPNTAAALGRRWDEVAAMLSLDPEGQVARALAARETWSGISVAFPTDGTDARFAVELSGLPVFDRDRSFRGYRGFGVCRDVARVVQPLRTSSPAAPQSENVVPFRASAPPDKPPTLTPVEQGAFSELANRLTARLRATDKVADDPAEAPTGTPGPPAEGREREAPPTRSDEATMATVDQRPILDRLPIGVLVYRLDRLIYANRAFLDWTGYQQLAALEAAGGLDALFVEPAGNDLAADNGAQALTIATNKVSQLPVEARLFTSPWEGESALVLMLMAVGGRRAAAAAKPIDREPSELRAVLDATADGVLVLGSDRSVLAANRTAEILFGYDRGQMTGLPFLTLFAPNGQRIALDTVNGAPSGEGREVGGRRRNGTAVALLMSVAKIDGAGDKLCATFRDISRWKKSEADILNAKRQAELASAAKSDFIAKLSHEIRTPLNAIIGFTEVMMQERFGPIGNDRYRQYLKDIRSSGGHLVSLLNDLLDLSKIEAGKLDLNFADVDLNELTQQCVALMQPQASRERIIIRTSLASGLPQVIADPRSVRQITLNLLSNSIKFTGVGGQVIVSTARHEGGGAVLRVRDTGTGMSEQDLAIALEPFRQLATSGRWGSSGTGLGLPLTKALAEANRASFSIRSAVDTGTLVEVAFPGTRLAAE
jgi:PAS domain S-box-containing protein